MSITMRALPSLLLLLAANTSAAQAVPTITLSGPRTTFGSDVELNSVRGAALLSDGRVVVADGGNSRVVVFAPSGSLQKMFGREGSGPGDFQNLYRLYGVGDTIVTWDSGLSRMVLYKPDGTIIRNVSLPAVAKHVVSIAAVRNATQYYATIRAGGGRPATGLYLDTVSVILVDGNTETPAQLGRRAFHYSYFAVEKSGTTTYNTPFLGATLMASAAGKLLTLPIGETEVIITRADGSTGGRVALPITRPNAPDRAKRFADSLIASVRESERDPGWVSRIRAAFGPNFPAARPAIAQRAVTVGTTVWFQSFQEPNEATTNWFIVDARQERLVGQVTLPKMSRVLAGTDRQVLLLLRDSDGVETIGLFDLRR
jgi:hypothetical protein